MITKLIIKYWGYILLLIIIIFLIIKIQFKNSKIEKLETQNNISLTLLDTIKVYKNKLNTLTYEKQSFNIKFNALEKEYDRLDKNSKNLVDKIRILEKEKNLISATNIYQSAVIDSLINNWPIIDETNHTLTFYDSTTFLQYNMLVNLQPPSLNIRKLTLPNELFISYKKSKESISVGVTNSSPYYKINDISSYIIPLDGNKKVPFKRYFIISGVSVVIGGTAALLLFN
jgi:hypothetical protein